MCAVRLQLWLLAWSRALSVCRGGLPAPCAWPPPPPPPPPWTAPGCASCGSAAMRLWLLLLVSQLCIDWAAGYKRSSSATSSLLNYKRRKARRRRLSNVRRGDKNDDREDDVAEAEAEAARMKEADAAREQRTEARRARQQSATAAERRKEDLPESRPSNDVSDSIDEEEEEEDEEDEKRGEMVEGEGVKDVPAPADASSRSAALTPWVQRFCSAPGHEFYLSVPKTFIDDPVTSAILADAIRSDDLQDAVRLLSSLAVGPEQQHQQPAASAALHPQNPKTPF